MTAQKACKLCFQESKDFQVIEENMREILDVLLLKIDFSLNEDYVICERCADSIYTFFEFKSVFLYMEDRIAPFIERHRLQRKFCRRYCCKVYSRSS
ncbi:hypothetical protein NQ318_000093 [Aromia moschata]|uniref:ZAD domain-containing protein n=1 Tax=Aromia moschata TaxID=1265417 RepID=A0AAV8YC34_9CUCU|nr:hypothetical protein NQ318_000093 [Aromia moschata]